MLARNMPARSVVKSSRLIIVPSETEWIVAAATPACPPSLRDRHLRGRGRFTRSTSNQTVQVYLAKSKPAKNDAKEAVDPEQKPARKDGKDKRGDRPADLPQVRMIVILAEPPDG